MRKEIFYFLSVASVLIVLVASCSRDSEDLISGAANNSCDTTAVSYSSTIVPILTANCYTCHGNASNGGSGGIILEGYSHLQKWAANGYLVGNVTHAPGYVAMPYGRDKLPDCEVNKIVAWVSQGAQDN